MCRLGAVAKCAPPLRDARESNALWERLRAGDIDVVASDHSPAPPEMKTGEDFFAIWGGIAGVQSTLPVLLSREVGYDQIARLTAGFAAWRFQLPGKGAIQIGRDADLVLVDAAASQTLAAEHLFQRHKQTPYLGKTFRGVVRRTILRGQTIFCDGFRDGAGIEGSRGRFVKPIISTYAESRTNA